MGRFRKKPVTIEAVYWNGKDTPSDLLKVSREPWLADAFNNGKIHTDGETLTVDTLEGVMASNDPCYIVRGVDGELYIVKREIFEKTYEAVI